MGKDHGTNIFSYDPEKQKSISGWGAMGLSLASIVIILLFEWWTPPAFLVTPFICTTLTLILAFFLKPSRLLIASSMFFVAVVIALLFFQQVTVQHFHFYDYLNTLMRGLGFMVASAMGFLFSVYRERSKNLLGQTISILQSMPAPVVVSDAAGYIIFVNQEAVNYCGLRKEDMISRRYVAIFMALSDEGSAMRRYREMFENEPTHVERLEIKLGDGSVLEQMARNVCIGTLENRLLVTLLEGAMVRM